MRRDLESPGQFPGVGIEGHDRAGIEIIAGPGLAGQHRRRIAGPPVNQVQVGIVGSGHPRHAARGRVRSAQGRRTVPLPLRLAGLGIDGPQVARQVVEISGDANDHVIANHQGRHGGPVSLFDIGNLNIPAHFAVFRVQRNQVRIGRDEEQPVLVHGNAAMPDVEPFVGRIGVVPDLMSRARIHRPDVVRHREVQHAVDQQRRRLQGRLLAGLKRPGQPQRWNVLRSDLGQMHCGACRNNRRDNSANCRQAGSRSSPDRDPAPEGGRKSGPSAPARKDGRLYGSDL